MTEDLTTRLTCALADAGARPESALALARHLGAEALWVLVRDAEVDALLPAAGFLQTIPGGRGWTQLLAACAEPGIHQAEVLFRGPDRVRRVVALVIDDRSVFAFVGGEPRVAELSPAVLGVLGALFRSENERRAADAAARLAGESARHTAGLIAAVDAARTDAERARASAEEATRGKDEFLAMLGHELRNPLAPISTALHLLQQSGDRGGSSRAYEVIGRQVAHLTRLVDDLLDVARITRGKIELRLEEIEVSQIVAKAVEIASPLLEARGHRLALSVPRTGLLVRADPTRLTQVLANLLTNAAKYTDPGGDIALSAEHHEHEGVVVRVRDRGIGISPALLPRVFDLFVQGQTNLDRPEGGLGLGLALVKNLLHLHGGTITASSEGLGKGSEFVVRLPALAAAPAPVKRPMPVTVRVPSARRILVVDDNADAADLLGEMLTLAGYEVAVTYDGPRALELAQRFHPETAILDLGLPVMDGHELALRLRAAGGTPPHLIALTGYGQDGDRAATRESGFEAHLVKPVDCAELVSAIESLGAEPAGSGRALTGPPGGI